MNEITRISIVDDHAIFREAMVTMLNSLPGYKVVAELDNGADVVDVINQRKPEIVLMDISLRGMDGIDALRIIRAQSLPCRVVILSMHSNRDIVTRAMSAGADAYVLKDEGFSQLLTAFENVKAGRRFVSPSLGVGISISDTSQAMDDEPDLTQREREIVAMISQGMSSKSIAMALKLSVKTIDAHRVNIYRKLGVNNTADVTRYAVRQGIISL